jgi:hypothetical protein
LQHCCCLLEFGIRNTLKFLKHLKGESFLRNYFMLILDTCGLKTSIDVKCPTETTDRSKLRDCRKCLFEECHQKDPVNCDEAKACIDKSVCAVAA